MRRRHGKRAGLGSRPQLLLAALGALALLALPSAAAAKDSNGDRIPDRWEKHHHLSLKVKQTGRDQDRDRLRNRAEFLAGSNPRDKDSDDDGTLDGDENAGTIASYDAESGRLTIDLYGGDTVSGLVTEQTRIECGDGGQDSGEDGATASDLDEDDSGSESEDGPDAGPPPGTEPEHGEDHVEGGDGASCTADALVVGAVVEEAELKLSDGVATFSEIELDADGDSSGDS